MQYAYRDLKPRIAPDVFLAPGVVVIGDVEIGPASSVWFGSVIRGDVHHVRIGQRSNIQDQCMLHVTGGRFPLVIGDNCTLGHRVTVHGCTLADHAFVGIGATVLDNCRMGEFAMLGAGSLLPPGKEVPARKLAMGIPARIVRDITDEEEEMIRRTAAAYAQRGLEYRNNDVFRPV